MGQDDWYRCTTWTESDRAAFHGRLQRSRGDYHKAQYARIQAGHLARAGELDGAKELLALVLSEYPDASQLASVHLQLGECLLAEGRTDAALGAFREALEAERANPKALTQVWIEFPWCVVSKGMVNLYEEAEEHLNWGRANGIGLFPVDRYRAHAVEALIADERGDPASAQGYARAALEAAGATHSGFRYHPEVGLVEGADLDVRRRLEALAADQTLS